MNHIVLVAIAPLALAGYAALIGAIVGVIVLKDQARAFAATVGVGLGGFFLVAAYVVTEPPELVVDEEALAGLEIEGIPKNDGEMAVALMARGNQAIADGDSLVANQSFEMARGLYRKLGNTLGEADVAYGYGRLAFSNGQVNQARANFAEALSLYEQGGLASGQARVLAGLGDVERAAADLEAAATYYNRARIQWERAPGPKATDHPILLLDDVADLSGGADASRAILAEAYEIFEQLKSPEGVADVAALTADLELRSRNVALALAWYEDARARYEAAGLTLKEADANIALARAQLQAGLNVAAGSSLERATEIYTTLAERRGIGAAELLRGDLERMQGNSVAADEHYLAAAEEMRVFGGPLLPEALLRFAEIQARAGEMERARVAMEQAASLGSSRVDPGLEVRVRVAGAVYSVATGKFTQAQQWVEQAVNAAERGNDAISHARARLAYADLEVKKGLMGRAAERYAVAIPLLEEAGIPMGQVVALLAQGDAYRNNDQPQPAAASYRGAAVRFDAIGDTVAETNRFLGLPPVSKMAVRTYGDGTPLRPGQREVPVVEDEAATAANLAAFPDQNREGREQLAAIEARLAEATEFARNAAN